MPQNLPCKEPVTRQHEVPVSEQFIKNLTTCQSRLLGYVLTLLPDYQAALDVVQNTNVVLWRKASDFREGSNFMAWVCQVARLEVLAYFRDQGRDRHFFGDELLGQLADKAQHRTQSASDLRMFLEDCLDLQSETDQKLLSDRYSTGTSVKDLAAEQGITPNRLSVHLCRLRRSLLECIHRRIAATRISARQGEPS